MKIFMYMLLALVVIGILTGWLVIAPLPEPANHLIPR